MAPFHPTVLHALNDDTEALKKLRVLLDVDGRKQEALPLPPPSASRAPERRLLLGRVVPRTDGSVVLVHLNDKERCVAVFAPPLSLNFRDALVYCSDYRVTGRRKPVLEVLRAHVHVLVHHPRYGCAPPVSVTRRVRVIAKTPIFGRQQRAFVLEVADFIATSSPLRVVFKGNAAVKWWPFLHPNAVLAVGDAWRLATLPDYPQVVVFKLNDNAPIYLADDAMSGVVNPSPSSSEGERTALTKPTCSPPRKRPRRGNGVARETTNVNAFFLGHSTVTFEGVVTDVLSDGRVQLDGRVHLHLGGDLGWLQGGRRAASCVRKGARIEALQVRIGYQRGKPTTLFPTARTTLHLLYFGNSQLASDTLPVVSPWYRYWRVLPPIYCLWAQELYDTLPAKFHLLSSLDGDGETEVNGDGSGSGGRNDQVEVSKRLLGTSGDPGLLEFLMARATGVSDLFVTGEAPKHLYDELFKASEQQDPAPSNTFACMPTIEHITVAANKCWYASVGASRKRTSRQRVVCRFTARELSAFLPISTTRPTRQKQEAAHLPDVMLVGFLKGYHASEASLVLSDATGAIFCECSGLLALPHLGAVVVSRNFHVVVESAFTSDNSSPSHKTTFVLPMEGLQVLIDGPYYAPESNRGVQAPPSQYGYRASAGSGTIRLTQTQQDDRNEDEFDDLPVVFIFVDQVFSITLHSDGEPQFRVAGHLLGAAASRDAPQWEMMRPSGTDDDVRWRCLLVLHGRSAVSLRPAIHEGSAYAFGCSDFADLSTTILKFCERRAASVNSTRPVVSLYTKSNTALWALQLGPAGLDALGVTDACEFDEPDKQFVSFNAVALHASSNENNSVRLVLLDALHHLYRVEITLKPRYPIPRALATGTQLRVVNARRGNDGLLTSCELTRIRLRDVPLLKNAWCAPPALESELRKHYSSSYLWGFCPDGAGVRPKSGIAFVRLSVLEVTHVKFTDGGGSDFIDAFAEARVDDGTASARLVCRSPRTVTALLDAPFGSPEAEWLMRVRPSYEKGSVPPPQSFAKLLARAKRSVRVLVRTERLGCVPSCVRGKALDSAIVERFPLGYNRRLYTAVATQLHMANIEALAFFFDDAPGVPR